MKRLGLIAAIMAVLVFGTEGILSLLRQRNIDVTLQVETSLPLATPDATQQAAGGPATPAAQGANSTLVIDPNGRVLVAVRWDYKIRPTFPHTLIRAEALDQSGNIVASDKYAIDCGSASLNCSGSTSLALAFGVQEQNGVKTAWPAGPYTVQVTRAFTELNTTILVRRPLTVVPQP